MALVLHLKVAQDVSSCRIGWNNKRLPGREAFSLIEINCSRYIRRNRVIVLSELLHAVDLDGQRDWDAPSLQFSCEGEHL